ncbi:MAG: aspartate--tRNA(Asn) ligase [Candidatus Melainabacteria bacterium]|nr:aspartate--tRNA(Asn) ligase [Candidatus Melainabacteria bacterium]
MSTERVSVKQASSREGHVVHVAGHVHSMRDLGKVFFINVRDASGVIQTVVEKDSLLAIAREISVETPVRISGKLVAQAHKNGGFEIQVETLEPLAKVVDTPPVELSKDTKMDGLSLSTLLDYRPITLRSPKVKAIFKIEAAITRAFREFLTNENFVEIHSPKIVATGTEGGAQLFKLDYFGTTAYLAQSPQFYKQIMVGVFERVFEVAPVYRAEEHDTSRHLNEYISLDLEMGFIESEQDIIAMQVNLLRYIFDHIREYCPDEVAIYGTEIPRIETIPQITLTEALELLSSKLGWHQEAQNDLDPEGERLLCEHFRKEHGSDFLYVKYYPLAARPFYTMPLSDPLSNGKVEPLSRGFDLLFRGLEVTTGGQRIHEYEHLRSSIAGRGLNPDDFAEYLQCFRFGMPPHGGLAIGLERITKQLLGLPSVKQTALFPRDINRLKP